MELDMVVALSTMGESIDSEGRMSSEMFDFRRGIYAIKVMFSAPIHDITFA